MNKEKKNKKEEIDIVEKYLKPALTIAALILIFVFAFSQMAMKIDQLAEEKAVAALKEYITKNDLTATLEQKREEIKTDTIEDVTVDSSKVTEDDMSELVENVSKAMVSIYNKQMWKNDAGVESLETFGSGSGVIIGDNGTELWILTNYHVVEKAKVTQVKFIDNYEIDVWTKGYDKEKDIAVLSILLKDIPKETQEKIAAIKIGDSNKTKAGQSVVVIGNALNQGQIVTKGVISKTDTAVDLPGGIRTTMIQVDAAINSGNSGGALLNMSGELIGIPTAKNIQSTVENTGYAIRISDVRETIEVFCAKEARKQSAIDASVYLGVEILETPMGVLITKIETNSPAYKSELCVGDYIVKIGDYKIKTVDDLATELNFLKAGELVTIRVSRPDGKEYTSYNVLVKLERKP